MSFLPITLNLSHKPVIVIGGGSIALRRVKVLLHFGATVKLYAETVHPEIKELNIEWREISYSPEQLQHSGLIVAATNDPFVNLRIADDAHQIGGLVNVTSDRNASDYHFPAITHHNEFTIAVSSSGKNLQGTIDLRDQIREVLND